MPDLDAPDDRTGRKADCRRQPGFLPGADIVPDPLAEVLGKAGPAVIAVITGVDGPSYRDVGSLMCFLADGTSSGSLTNGCIEADLALHAQTALMCGRPVRLRYGRGSPFFDIRLPCGGGLDVALFPVRDKSALAEAGYVPNGAARSLASRRTRTMGAVVPTVDSALFARVVDGSGRPATTT